MTTRKRIALVVAVIVLAAAVVAGILWSMTSDGEPEALPETIGHWEAEDSDAFLDANGIHEDERDDRLERTRAVYDYNNEQFSKAFDGASVVTRIYWHADDEEAGRLLAVEIDAESGPVVPLGFTDPDVLGVAAPRDEVVEADGVQCLLGRTNPPLAERGSGDEPDPEDLEPDTVLCQRTDSSRTLRVSGYQVGLDDVVSVTNELWER